MIASDILQPTMEGSMGKDSSSKNAGTLLLTSQDAHFIFLTYVPMHNVTVKFVLGKLTTNGGGTQTAEIGLFTTVGPPRFANLSMTKLVSTGTVTDLTAGAVKEVGNTSSFNQVIPAGSYLWAGIRTAMGTTQATIQTECRDPGWGGWQRITSASALTGAGPFSATLVDPTMYGNRPPSLTAYLN